MIRSEIIKGQKSWVLENKNIKLCLAEQGGQMAPAAFMKDTKRPIEPYYINPWAEEDVDLSDEPDVLVPLRGNFFCMPYRRIFRPYLFGSSCNLSGRYKKVY